MESGDQANLDIGKRDILLSNVQLVDVQTIMWQGFQRLRDEDLFPTGGPGVASKKNMDASATEVGVLRVPEDPSDRVKEMGGDLGDLEGSDIPGRELILGLVPGKINSSSGIPEDQKKRPKSRLNLKTIIGLEAALSPPPSPRPQSILLHGVGRVHDGDSRRPPLVDVLDEQRSNPAAARLKISGKPREISLPAPSPGDILVSDPRLCPGGSDIPPPVGTPGEKPGRKMIDEDVPGNGVATCGDVVSSVVVSEGDMDHNHHSLLLSQISQSGALPAITPSQVSSVLSELLVEPPSSSLGEPCPSGGRFRLGRCSPVVPSGEEEIDPVGGRFTCGTSTTTDIPGGRGPRGCDGLKKQGRRNDSEEEEIVRSRDLLLLRRPASDEAASESFVKLEPSSLMIGCSGTRQEESREAERLNNVVRIKEYRKEGSGGGIQSSDERRDGGESGRVVRPEGVEGSNGQRCCKVIVECKLGRVRWYKCRNCGFLAVRKTTVEEHCSLGDKDSQETQDGLRKGIPGCSNKKRTKLRCLGCQNVFHSGQSLKVHLTADHEVLDSDVADLLVTCVVANKLWKSEAAKLRSASTGKPETLRSDGVLPLPAVPEPGGVPEGRRKEGKPLSGEGDEPLQEFGVSPPMDSIDKGINPHSHGGLEGIYDGGYGTVVPPPSGKARKGPRKRGKEGLPASGMGGDGKPPLDRETKMTDEGQREKLDGDGGGGGLSHLFGKLRPPPRPKFPTDGVKIEKRDPGNTLRCDFDGCNYKFDYQVNLDYHKQCHSEDSKWKCPECETISSNWPKLSVHLWKQHSIDMELYSCDKCSYKTNSLSRLINVHKWIHGEERLFSCDVCPKSFKNVKQLMNHKGIHRAKERRLSRVGDGGGGGLGRGGEGSQHPSTDCSLCGRSFSDGRMLRQHVDIVHRRLRPYLCSVCGHSAGSKGSLRIHARIHTGEKPYSCPDCDYVTGDHNSLRRHKMQHTGDKPYNCPFCPYACIQATTYKSHLKNKHPGMDEGLMFSCDLCNFRTVKKENFLAHSSCHNLSGNQVGDTTVDDPFRILDASKLITQVDVSRMKRAKREEDVFSEAEEGMDVGKTDLERDWTGLRKVDN